MTAAHDPGPDEGRGVAARLVYDPRVATVSEEEFNELVAIMRDGPAAKPLTPRGRNGGATITRRCSTAASSGCNPTCSAESR
ncbi:hypothetical protein [Sphingomonas hankookensis]|uniref:hypothetical protein n=1 Tax=Sphingomonas hankookensis TaxID=563996 RepID=UPI003F797260